jgi:ADP-ribose pyrophosphatase YjhB (NUDIX family)
VIVPYLKIEGELYVGVLRQYRHNHVGEVLNVPRGFLDLGESHDEAARREFSEETGYARASAMVPLEGEPANPNSSFFFTPDGEGVRFFAVQLALDDVENRDGRIVFRRDRTRTDPISASHRLAERVQDVQFIYWADAALVSDLFTVSAVARLLAHLRRDPRRRMI